MQTHTHCYTLEDPFTCEIALVVITSPSEHELNKALMQILKNGVIPTLLHGEN